MKVLCIPQAFKGTLGALEAASAMREGVLRVAPNAEVLTLPMADGGDDTLDVLVSATGGPFFTTEVVGPLGSPVRARWGVLGDGTTAVVEMAEASGLRLVPPDRRDPRIATTYGTGQLIRAALDAGFRHIVLGVGGSATVDGGTGAACALGARFLDAQGRELPRGGAALARMATIDLAAIDPRALAARITVACDVDMTLCGEDGAWLFAAQKGATPAVSRELRQALEHFAGVVEAQTGVRLAALRWGGPAGGLSGGLHAFCGAELAQGAELVMRLTGIERHFPGADLVLIGEGQMDRTSFRGKGPSVVASRARAAGVPVVAVVGRLGDDVPDLAPWGIGIVETLMAHAPSEPESHRRARDLVVEATAAALRRFTGRGDPAV